MVTGHGDSGQHDNLNIQTSRVLERAAVGRCCLEYRLVSILGVIVSPELMWPGMPGGPVFYRNHVFFLRIYTSTDNVVGIWLRGAG